MSGVSGLLSVVSCLLSAVRGPLLAAPQEVVDTLDGKGNTIRTHLKLSLLVEDNIR